MADATTASATPSACAHPYLQPEVYPVEQAGLMIAEYPRGTNHDVDFQAGLTDPIPESVDGSDFHGTGFFARWDGARGIAFGLRVTNGPGVYCLTIRYRTVGGAATRFAETRPESMSVTFAATSDAADSGWGTADVRIRVESPTLVVRNGTGVMDLDEIAVVGFDG